jgi:spore maturation protein CgeB
MKILCAFGKYSYGDPEKMISPEYASFIPAFKHLGHEVVHFELWDRNVFTDYADLNQKLVETIERECPDVMFAVQLNYEIWIETLQLIRSTAKVITVCWATDDSWKYREVSRFIGKYYDIITTTYENVLKLYKEDGISTVLLTQWAVSTENIKEPLPASECRYNVSYIGAAHGNRKKRVEVLRQQGIIVTCYGYGWPNGPVSPEEVIRIVRNSVISLNFANSRGENQIKARTFEIPGAGGFLLTEYAPGLERFYSIGKEVEVFSDDHELVDKIQYYLKHEKERDLIARAGYHRTIHEHTYDIRMEKVLQAVEKVNHKRDGSNSVLPSVHLDHAIASHKLTFALRLIRNCLVVIGILLLGKKQGPRAARRFLYEASWRIFGEKTYTAAGLPGRLFPDQ